MKRTFTKYPSNYVRATKFFYDDTPVTTDGSWKLYMPATFEAAKSLAKMGGTTAIWDTSYTPYYFDTYMEKGPLFIFVNTSTGEKYQSHPATRSWLYDANDRNLGKQALIDFLDSHPNFADVFAGQGYDFFYVKDDPEYGDINPRFASDFED